MTMEIIGVIIGSVLGSSVLATIAQSFFGKKKVAAESTQVIVTTILEWATKLTVRIDALEAQLKVKDEEIMALHEEVKSRDLVIKDLQYKVNQLERKA